MKSPINVVSTEEIIATQAMKLLSSNYEAVRDWLQSRGYPCVLARSSRFKFILVEMRIGDESMRKVHEGIWIVTFEDNEIGFFDQGAFKNSFRQLET